MMPQELVEGVDYYMENGFMVFTAIYLRKRGYCCNQAAGIVLTVLERTGAGRVVTAENRRENRGLRRSVRVRSIQRCVRIGQFCKAAGFTSWNKAGVKSRLHISTAV